MGDKSAIEWTDATWNPVSGCSKVSQGCKNCYAERLWPKVAGAEAKRTGQPPRAFTDVRCHPERLDAPLRWRKPRRIFVNSMSDLFHEDVPELFIDDVFSVMATATWHTYQILTKRPERMMAYMRAKSRESAQSWQKHRQPFDFPRSIGLLAAKLPDPNPDGPNPGWPLPNVWLGVSVEDQETADYRIPLLLQTTAAIRFVSYEPAIGPADFTEFLLHNESGDIVRCTDRTIQKLHWVIAGGESGPNARPAHPDWFRSARGQCAAAGVAFFFKQWGEWRDDMDFMREKDLWDETRIRCSDYRKIEGLSGAFVKVGKKAAGRLLDGRTWDEYPA